MKFYQWYSQAMGSIIGIASCIYCYLNGNLIIFSNLDGNFDLISFNGVLASYTLYPLCLLTFIMALLLAIPSILKKKIINIEITSINSTLVYLTVIIGILGCNIYFLIPALLLLTKDIESLYKYHKRKDIKTSNDNKIIEEAKDSPNQIQSNTQLLLTKNEIATHLLNNNANIDFISEITGLSKNHIHNLDTTKKESINK